MPGTFTYRRSGSPPVYSNYIEIEMLPSQEPKVWIQRFRSEQYVSGGGCGSCGYQRPVRVEHRNVSRTQDVKGTEVQVGRYVYQFADILPGDLVRIELHEAKKQQESITYTATTSGFTFKGSRQSAYRRLGITLINGDKPGRHQSANWWEQTEGVARVRYGFATKSVIPIPRTRTPEQALLRVLEEKQQPEPAQLN